MMDLPQPPPPPQAATNKLRIMVSYGGRIVPVPYKLKSLFYAGGETRIISVPAFIAATFSTFSSHIATVLQVGYPFSLKYQVPLHDLDSLISISTEEDLFIFLEELERLSSSPSPAPARIRLFLFPIKQQQGGDHELAVSDIGTELTQIGLTHPKTESWFVDALKSAKMMQQKREMGGFGGEGGQSEGLCVQESMMLETTSSFGSSSSSVSLSNLPPIKAGGDETVIHYQDNKTTMPSIESTTCDIGIMASPVSYAQTVTYQDPVIPVVAMENKVSLNPIELSDTKISELIPPGLPMHKTVQVAGPGYPLSTQLDQLQQQSLQFVQMSNPMSVLPVTSYYPTHNMMLPHQPLQYLPNQPYSVSAVPVGKPKLTMHLLNIIPRKLSRLYLVSLHCFQIPQRLHTEKSPQFHLYLDLCHKLIEPPLLQIHQSICFIMKLSNKMWLFLKCITNLCQLVLLLGKLLIIATNMMTKLHGPKYTNLSLHHHQLHCLLTTKP